MKKKDKDAGDAQDFTGMPASTVVTPADIQSKEFNVSRFGGYRMRDVDEFLDQITVSMTKLTEENDRLRSASGLPVARVDRGARPGGHVAAGGRDHRARPGRGREDRPGRPRAGRDTRRGGARGPTPGVLPSLRSCRRNATSSSSWRRSCRPTPSR